MKKLDWYIVRKFLGTFFFMIAAFCVVAVVFDVSENVEDLVNSEAPLSAIILDYYVNFCLSFGNLLSSFIIFLTIILFTSRLAQNTEIVAMLSGGVSFWRILRPYLIASGFLVTISLVLAHFILPIANQNKVDFEFTYTKPDYRISEHDMYREIGDDQIAYFRQITAERKVGYKFALEQWRDGRLTSKLTASKAKFIEQDSIWRLTDGRIRSIYEDGTESIRLFSELDSTIDMVIADFGRRKEIVSTLGYQELKSYILEEESKGSGDVAMLEIELHSRTSNAFAIFVLTIIGMSIASRKVRGGTGVHLFLAVLVGFTYVFCQKITTVAATNVGMPAWIAVWIPNILFLILGIVIYIRAPK
ncbi:MAG: LptF/LptG family permease [Bacteroidota bacterium]